MLDRFRLFAGPGPYVFDQLNLRPESNTAPQRRAKKQQQQNTINNFEDDGDIEPPSREEIDRGFEPNNVDRNPRDGREIPLRTRNMLLFNDLRDPGPKEEMLHPGRKKKQGTQALLAPGTIGFGGFV